MLELCWWDAAGMMPLGRCWDDAGGRMMLVGCWEDDAGTAGGMLLG